MAKQESWKNVKSDEGQGAARSSAAGRPDFMPPCDGVQYACSTHSRGKCFKLHWCCHLGWCHCKFMYQPMTNVCQLPSTAVPSGPTSHAPSFNLSVLLAQRFLRTASCLAVPGASAEPGAAGRCATGYVVRRLQGRARYVKRPTLTRCPKSSSKTPTKTPGHPHGSCDWLVSSDGNPLQRVAQPTPQELNQGRTSRRSCSSSNPEDSGLKAWEEVQQREQFDRGPGSSPSGLSWSLVQMADAFETNV